MCRMNLIFCQRQWACRISISPLRCCPFTHATVYNILSKETFAGNEILYFPLALTEIWIVPIVCFLVLLEWLSLPRALFSQAEAIIMSEALAVRRKK